MIQERPDLPEPLLVPDSASMVSEYLPDLRSLPTIDRVSGYFALAMLALLIGLAGYNVLGWLGGVVAVLLVVGSGVAAYEAYRRRAMAEFDDLVENRPWELYGEVAERFRRDLARQRSRLLGPESEWGRARAPLEEALAEARRSEAYWKERAKGETVPGTAREHERTARELSAKFRAALEELEGRSQILLDFFATCEAKLAALEYSRRDVEESRRLARLSDRADQVSHDARNAMAEIGHDVLRHALEVGAALGAAERFRIRQSAGDVPVEQIEIVADRILASAESERRALASLVEGSASGQE